jgi:hypothetical protein
MTVSELTSVQKQNTPSPQEGFGVLLELLVDKEYTEVERGDFGGVAVTDGD